MSHQDKQEIFDQYARSKEYDDWNDVFEHFIREGHGLPWLYSHMFNACDLVQAEQQKRIAENVNSETIQTTFGPFECYDKASIINPENIIS